MNAVYPLAVVGTIILLGCTTMIAVAFFAGAAGKTLPRWFVWAGVGLAVFGLFTHATGYGWPA